MPRMQEVEEVSGDSFCRVPDCKCHHEGAIT